MVKKKSKEIQQDKVRVATYVPASMLGWLRKQAEIGSISESAVIRVLIRQAMEGKQP